MARIDDPLGKAIEAIDEDLSPARFDAVLDTLGLLDWRAGVLRLLQNHFSRGAIRARTISLLEIAAESFRALEGSVRDLRERQNQFDARLSAALANPVAEPAVITAVSLAATAPSPTTIELIGTALGRHLARPTTSADEIVAFLNDLYRLTPADLDALQLLGQFHGPMLTEGRMPMDANMFTRVFADLIVEVDRHMDRERFFSHCARLSGFGLALEVQRNSTLVSPRDHCYRLTTRGWQLLVLLGKDRRTLDRT